MGQAVQGQSLPDRVVLCHKPTFYTKFGCEHSNSSRNISQLIMLDVTRMPYNTEQWFHVDVIPTRAAALAKTILKIKYAMIQISDSQDQIIGRVGEHIPCKVTGHLEYYDGKGEISELYRNPGPPNIDVIECTSIDHLSFNAPPTVGVFSFYYSVEAFYVNFAFTKEEADYIKDPQNPARFFITTLLVDESEHCHLHRVEQLKSTPAEIQYPRSRDVPIDCHVCGQALQRENQKSLLMDRAVAWSKLLFLPEPSTPTKRLRRHRPQVHKPEWKYAIDEYNFNINGIDAEGYTAAERKKLYNEEAGVRVGSVPRNPKVPLVEVIEIPDTVELKICSCRFYIFTILLLDKRDFSLTIISFVGLVDDDDEDCDDRLREKKPENVEYEIAKLYMECKYSRHCISDPIQCLEDRDCMFLATWGKEGDYLRFGVMAKAVTYIAVALSKDDLMVCT